MKNLHAPSNPTPWTVSKTDRYKIESGDKCIGFLETFDGGDRALILRAVNAHDELLERVRLDGNAYHTTHNGGFFRDCANLMCREYKRIIANADRI